MPRPGKKAVSSRYLLFGRDNILKIFAEYVRPYIERGKKATRMTFTKRYRGIARAMRVSGVVNPQGAR
jgi:hypothetical protein